MAFINFSIDLAMLQIQYIRKNGLNSKNTTKLFRII